MFLKFIFHPLVKVMFVSDSVGRVSSATLPTSHEESSKPAASAVGGPFPYTPVTKAVVAGIGCSDVDMTETQASLAMRSGAARPLAPH